MPNVDDSDDVVTNPAKVLKLALAHATFDNKDITGNVAALLDSLATDMDVQEYETDSTTLSLSEQLLDTLREELDSIAGRFDDDDEDEIIDGTVTLDDEDEVEHDLDDDANDDDDDDDDTLDRDDDDDDDEVVTQPVDGVVENGGNEATG